MQKKSSVNNYSAQGDNKNETNNGGSVLKRTTRKFESNFRFSWKGIRIFPMEYLEFDSYDEEIKERRVPERYNKQGLSKKKKCH